MKENRKKLIWFVMAALVVLLILAFVLVISLLGVVVLVLGRFLVLVSFLVVLLDAFAGRLVDVGMLWHSGSPAGQEC